MGILTSQAHKCLVVKYVPDTGGEIMTFYLLSNMDIYKISNAHHKSYSTTINHPSTQPNPTQVTFMHTLTPPMYTPLGGSSHDLDMWLITMFNKFSQDRVVEPLPNWPFKWGFYPNHLHPPSSGLFHPPSTPTLFHPFQRCAFIVNAWLHTLC